MKYILKAGKNCSLCDSDLSFYNFTVTAVPGWTGSVPESWRPLSCLF